MIVVDVVFYCVIFGPIGMVVRIAFSHSHSFRLEQDDDVFLVKV